MAQTLLTLEAVNPTDLGDDLFLGVRLGKVQKLAKASSLGSGRNRLVFPGTASEHNTGKLELFQRVSVAKVKLARQDEECALQLNTGSALCFRLSTTHSQGTEAKLEDEKASRQSADALKARAYLKQHDLEHRLSEAMRELLRELPANPEEFLFQQLRKSGAHANMPSTFSKVSATRLQQRPEQRTGQRPDQRAEQQPVRNPCPEPLSARILGEDRQGHLRLQMAEPEPETCPTPFQPTARATAPCRSIGLPAPRACDSSPSRVLWRDKPSTATWMAPLPRAQLPSARSACPAEQLVGQVRVTSLQSLGRAGGRQHCAPPQPVRSTVTPRWMKELAVCISLGEDGDETVAQHISED